MGKASSSKKNRKVLPTVTDCRAVTEYGRLCVEQLGMEIIMQAKMEAIGAGMAYPRILFDGGSQYFAYDLESPDAATALIALLKELRHKFGDYDRVPEWLAMLAIEEPWEHAARGHTVRRRDVIALHDAFPDIMVTPMATWEKVAQKHKEFAAEQEREILDRVTRHAAVRHSSACRI